MRDKKRIAAIVVTVILVMLNVPFQGFAVSEEGSLSVSDNSSQATAIDQQESEDNSKGTDSEMDGDQIVGEQVTESGNEGSSETPEKGVESKALLGAPAPASPVKAGVPSGTVETRDPWYPSVTSEANGWQIVAGDYRDGQHGATTQKTNASKSVVIRKNILPTKDENIFTVALKVRTMASWADLLDATSMRIQNGNSDNSSKVHYFEILPRGSSSIPVDVYFMNAPNTVSENSLPGNYKVVYKKTYYLDPSNTGMWFLYFNNLLIGIGDHGGQKQKVEPGVDYYVPIGTTMQNYEALHHAAVATQVEDIMAPGVSYIEGSARNNTQIPGVSGRTLL